MLILKLLCSNILLSELNIVRRRYIYFVDITTKGYVYLWVRIVHFKNNVGHRKTYPLEVTAVRLIITPLGGWICSGWSRTVINLKKVTMMVLLSWGECYARSMVCSIRVLWVWYSQHYNKYFVQPLQKNFTTL